MLINNVELPDIDTADADVMEQYENSMDEFSVKMQSIDTKNQKASQVIREQCHAVFEVFNGIFGNGTDKKLFGDKCNLTVCVNAMDQLTKAVKENDVANAEKILALAPKPNRQQQRKQNKGKKNKQPFYNNPKLVKR